MQPNDRDPQPVYLVPRPKRRVPGAIRSAAGITGLLLLVVALRAVLSADAPRPPAERSAPHVTPGQAGPSARPTADLNAAIVAADESLDRFLVRLDEKAVACDALLEDETARDACLADYDVLVLTYDRLGACLDNIASVADVAACEREAGVH